MTSKNDEIEAAARWLKDWVIGLNLCPFAKTPHDKGLIRFALDRCEDPYEGLATLLAEITLLRREETQTTLIVYSNNGPFADFDDFMDYCAAANELLIQEGLEGEVQLAYFHPHFVFEGAEKNDPNVLRLQFIICARARLHSNFHCHPHMQDLTLFLH